MKENERQPALLTDSEFKDAIKEAVIAYIENSVKEKIDLLVHMDFETAVSQAVSREMTEIMRAARMEGADALRVELATKIVSALTPEKRRDL